MKKYFLIALTVSFLHQLEAQDIHFSQFFHSPFNLNPALAGQFDGDYRFIANQRTQWRSVTVPYSTFGLSADARSFLDVKDLGTSFSLYQDRAGDSRLSTLKLNLGGAWLMRLSQDSLHTASLGVQLGMTHRSIDYSKLRYDNQYDGFQYNSSIDPNETYPRDSRTYLDVHIGAAWFFKPNKRESYSAGIGFYNLNTPEQSYFDASVPLDGRVNIHADAHIAVSADWDVMPAILFMSQGKYKELVLGGSGRHIVEDQAGMFRSVFAGFYFRTRDAGYLMAGMDYDNWRAALSYDFNLSDLRPASSGRGGLEIALIYVIRKFRPQIIAKRICPEYL